MQGLPAGKKSLRSILSTADPASQVIDLVILIDYLLSTLDEGRGGTATRERVDRYAKLFAKPKDVHFGITIRNRLSHTDPGERHPSSEEVIRARDHLDVGVRGLLPHLDERLARSVSGAKFTWRTLLPALWFLGIWQLYFVCVRAAFGRDIEFAGARELMLLVGFVLLHLGFFPFLSRLVPGLKAFFKVMLFAYVGGLIPVVVGVVAFFSAPDADGIVEGFTGWLGGTGAVLSRVLGDGVFAFAPWLLFADVSFWDRVVELEIVTLTVFASPILLALFAKLWAHQPMKLIERLSDGRTVLGRWADALPLAAGAFLVVERVWSLFR